MTCGLHPQPGHETHLCAACAELTQDCEATCRLGNSCNFRSAVSIGGEIALRKKSGEVVIV